MLKAFSAWLESRTGYKALVHEALDEPIPGGARWRYVFGSALTATFAIQLVTGLLLMTAYSPSSTTAWGSVYYITYAMDGGWFLRGLHHFGSSAMVVLLMLHLIQVTLAGAYRAPREINWWLGLALMFLTLGFSLTGYLLPWDQKGFWATKVATKIAGTTPGIGPELEKVIVGGTEYGNQTLTRFYGLHVGVLPALLIGVLALHVALFRKHGVTHPPRATGVEKFWPRQIFMDTVACAIVFAAVAALVLWEGGANLDAPADPSSQEYPARPEWYFLGLFQLLKKLPGRYEMVGTMVVPGAIFLVSLLLPFFDRVLPRRLAHFLACAFIFGLVGGGGYLMVEAVLDDARDTKFQESRKLADRARDLALKLADPDRGGGIPPEGAFYVLQRSPEYRGRSLFEQKCLGCHAYEGRSQAPEGSTYKGMDLAHFGSRAWVYGLLKDPEDPHYVVRVPASGDPASKGTTRLNGMKSWKEASSYEDSELKQLADFVATRLATIPAETAFEEWIADPAVKAHPAFEDFVEDCCSCHAVGNLGPEGQETKNRPAPSLFAWGSPQWTAKMIRRPGAPHLYGYLRRKEQQMPPFDENQLTDGDLNTLVRFLRDDYAGAPTVADGSGRAKPIDPR